MKIDVEGICEVLGNARMFGLRAQVRELDADWHRLVSENMRLNAQVLKCAEETQKACSEAAQYKEWFARAEEELQETRARADKAERERDEADSARALMADKARNAQRDAEYNMVRAAERNEFAARLVDAEARADKAEADLASCLAATNEALEEALTHGREAEDGPHRALVQAVRTATRLGAEEMRESAAVAIDVLVTAQDAKTQEASQGGDVQGVVLGAMRARDFAGIAAAVRLLPLPGDEVKT